MSQKIEFVRLVGTERRVGETLSSVSRHWQGEKERFLFVSPHDDDVVLGGGLMIQLARRENIPVYILIVTDGSMGYCSEEEQTTISMTRRAETFACYQAMGVPKENIIWAGFPDCQMNQYRGRRRNLPGDQAIIRGYTGLQNAFTFYLRKIRPTQCFLPTSNDLHPDHRIAHEEFLISLFHSGGDIWPELGDPLAKVPYVHEMAVYCDFPDAPKLQVRTPDEYLERKVDGIMEFKSQKQISSLVDIVRSAGAQEYYRPVEFKLYHPDTYRNLFVEHADMPVMRS